jgi:hypothetical protein
MRRELSWCCDGSARDRLAADIAVEKQRRRGHAIRFGVDT